MLRYAFHRTPREGWRQVPLWLQLVPFGLAVASLALGWLDGALLEFVLVEGESAQ
jgi:hypothetical protein